MNKYLKVFDLKLNGQRPIKWSIVQIHKYIEEIYLLADAAFSGSQKYFRVHIFPFRMTDENLQRHASSRWLDFWQNLAEGGEVRFLKVHTEVLMNRSGCPDSLWYLCHEYIYAVYECCAN